MKLKEHLGILALLAFFLVIGFCRLNDLSLYTDSTRYLIWGNSVAHGKGFVDDTQPEPDYFVVNAPLYAVLLTPVEILFPLSILAAKLWTLLWGAVALFLFYLWLLRGFGKATALAGTALFAFTPLMLVLSTEVLSEAPFLVVMMTIFLTIESFGKDFIPRKPVLITFLICLGLVTLLREVGASLVIAAALYFLFQKQYRLAATALIVALILFGIWALRNSVWVGAPPTAQSTNLQFFFQHFVTPPSSSLLSEFTQRATLNFEFYAPGLSGFILYFFPPNLLIDPSAAFKATFKILSSLQDVLRIIFGLLVVIGIIIDLRRSLMAQFRVFLLFGYGAIILFYPVQDIRFFLPVIPLLLFYGIQTTLWLNQRFAADWKRFYPISIALVVLLSVPNLLYLVELVRTNLRYQNSPEQFYNRTQKSGIQSNFYAMPWNLLGQWIGIQLPEDAAIASPVKELAPFIGNRKLLEMNNGVPTTMFESLLRDNAVAYVLAPTLWEDFMPYELAMNESKRFRFKQVHRIAGLNLFKVQSKLRDSCATITVNVEQENATGASGILRSARFELLKENYSTAVRKLFQANRLAPHRPEIIYQLVVVSTLMEDSLNAAKHFQTLFTTPQSGAYVSTARIHLDIMNKLLEARTFASKREFSIQRYNAASSLWNLGYPAKAYRLLREALQTDSTYFTGLLWGWHYAIQSGDTTQARHYLKTLLSLQPDHPIVREFKIIDSLFTRLHRSSPASEKSSVHIGLSLSYENLELWQESLDEAERAICENSANAQAWMRLGELFKERGNKRAAATTFRRVLEIDPQNQSARSNLMIEE